MWTPRATELKPRGAERRTVAAGHGAKGRLVRPQPARGRALTGVWFSLGAATRRARRGPGAGKPRPVANCVPRMWAVCVRAHCILRGSFIMPQIVGGAVAIGRIRPARNKLCSTRKPPKSRWFQVWDEMQLRFEERLRLLTRYFASAKLEFFSLESRLRPQVSGCGRYRSSRTEATDTDHKTPLAKSFAEATTRERRREGGESPWVVGRAGGAREGRRHARRRAALG